MYVYVKHLLQRSIEAQNLAKNIMQNCQIHTHTRIFANVNIGTSMCASMRQIENKANFCKRKLLILSQMKLI